MSNLFQNSEIFFLNIISKYDIILDDDYNNIKEIYFKLNKNIHDINPNINLQSYDIYINLFKKYTDLNDDINFIYYIIILYYINKDTLLNYIRFFTSKLYNYKLVDNTFKIKNYNELINFNKVQLINYLHDIINYNTDVLLFFIITIQLYL